MLLQHVRRCLKMKQSERHDVDVRIDSLMLNKGRDDSRGPFGGLALPEAESNEAEIADHASVCQRSPLDTSADHPFTPDHDDPFMEPLSMFPFDTENLEFSNSPSVGLQCSMPDGHSLSFDQGLPTALPLPLTGPPSSLPTTYLHRTGADTAPPVPWQTNGQNLFQSFEEIPIIPHSTHSTIRSEEVYQPPDYHVATSPHIAISSTAAHHTSSYDCASVLNILQNVGFETTFFGNASQTFSPMMPALSTPPPYTQEWDSSSPQDTSIRRDSRNPIVDPITQVPEHVHLRPNVDPISTAGCSPPNPTPKRARNVSRRQRKKQGTIRKQGACIRCRMLRKACSDGDPCAPCATVSTPRKWVNTCRRVKLHEEDSVFEAALNHNSMLGRLQGLRQDRRLGKPEPDCLTISFGYGPAHALLTIRRIRVDRQGEHRVGGKVVIDPGYASVALDQIVAIARYVEDESSQLWAFERSPYMASTVAMAAHLTTEKHDEVLSMVLQLWTATMLLVDDTIPLNMTMVPLNDARAWPATNVDYASSVTIKIQVRAALEEVIGSIATKLLPKLDSRMWRPKGQEFETYLASVLLLNSAERLCWLAQHWPSLHQSRVATVEEQQTSSLLQKGEVLAGVIQLMLGLRDLVPKICRCPDGLLVADLEASADQRRWVQQLNISEHTVQMMCARPYLDDDCRSMDGRFWARTLMIEEQS